MLNWQIIVCAITAALELLPIGKRNQHLGPADIYLDDLSKLDPEEASLYFPKRLGPALWAGSETARIGKGIVFNKYSYYYYYLLFLTAIWISAVGVWSQAPSPETSPPSQWAAGRWTVAQITYRTPLGNCVTLPCPSVAGWQTRATLTKVKYRGLGSGRKLPAVCCEPCC